MKKYESVFIFDESKLESTSEAIVAGICDFIVSNGGKVVESEDMGRKTFTYPIKKKNSGLYWNLVFELDPAKVVELKNNYRLVEAVLRMEVFVFDRPEEIIALNTKRV
ncbi:MAG: 30S ribosomal protein S6 [Lentisphaeria bacterium]